MVSTGDAPDSPQPIAALDTAAAAPSPEGPASAKPRRGGIGALGALLFGLIGGVAGALAVAFIPVKIPGTVNATMQAAIDRADLPQLSARIAALEQRTAGLSSSGDGAALSARLQSAEKQIAALNAQLTGLPGQTGTPSAGSDDMKALATGLAASVAEMKGRVETLAGDVSQAQNLAARIAALETRVPADLAAELAALAPNGEVVDLTSRVTKLETNTSAYDAKRAAAAIALANLARAAGSGLPFASELAAVRLANVDAALVEPLAPFATKGVRPITQLAEDFPEAARKAILADRAAAPNWWLRFWANITSLFVIRSEDARSGGSVDAILSRAGSATKTGNLAGALAEVSRLHGPAADALSGWRAQAQARVALDQIITKLSAQILADLHS